LSVGRGLARGSTLARAEQSVLPEHAQRLSPERASLLTTEDRRGVEKGGTGHVHGGHVASQDVSRRGGAADAHLTAHHQRIWNGLPTAMTIDRSACPAPRHGTAAAYTGAGCKCWDAVLAGSLYRSRLKNGEPELVNAVPTRRRLHALNAIGWGMAQLADPLGCGCPQAPNRIGRAGLVRRTTAERVAYTFDLLRDTPGPADQARSHARRMGYIPAGAWTIAALETDGPEGDIAALLTWMYLPDAPTDERGPVAQLLGRFTTLTTSHCREVLRRATALRANGVTTVPG
jgi:hypothetical protein